MSLEVLKSIPGFSNYKISSWGRVYSINTNEFMKPQVHDKGYLRVDLYDDTGRKRHMKIHRLVACAFVPNIFNKPHINHIDGNNQNNSYTNLEWVTDAENKAKRKGLIEMNDQRRRKTETDRDRQQ